MQAAAGANTLHNLLSNVAALSEAQATHLAGLLGQVAFADVLPIPGDSGSDAGQLQGLRASRRGAGFEQRVPENRSPVSGYPQFIVGRERLIAANQGC